MPSRRNKGLEETIPKFDRHPRSIVPDLENGFTIGGLQPDLDPTTLPGHGVPSVHHQVEQHATQGHRVSHNRNDLLRQSEPQLDSPRHQVAEHSLMGGDQPGKVQCPGWRALAAGKEKQLTNHLDTLVGQVSNRRARFGGRLWLGEQPADVKCDGCQEVIEIVGDSAGKPSHRLHLFGLSEPCLSAHRIGDIPRHEDRVGEIFRCCQRTLKKPVS